MRNTAYLFAALYVLSAAWLLALLNGRPRWWRRLWLRRDLRALAYYRRNLRKCAATAEADYRAGDPTAGPVLAAVAVWLVDCDEAIDAALDQLDALK